MKKFFIIFLIPLLLVACGEESNKQEELTPDAKQQTDINNMENNENKKQEKTDNKDITIDSEEQAKDEKNNNDAKNTKDETDDSNVENSSIGEEFFNPKEMNRYHNMALDFIKELNPKNEMASEWYEDFNSDSKIEGIIFIQRSGQISELVFLNMEGKKASLLSKLTITNLENDDLWDNVVYDGVEFIDIDGFEHTVPCIFREPNPNASSYMFFHVEDDYIDSFLNTDNHCDVGTTELVDEDNNGTIDHLILNRWGYDVFYYPLSLKYKFDNTLFIFDSGSIELGAYPKAPIDVVKEYIFLSYIRDYNRNQIGEFTNIKNLDERLAELTDLAFDSQFIFSKDLLTNLAIQIPDGTEIKDEVHENDASVIVYPPEDNELGDQTTNFVLKKEDDKWKITNIVFLD